MKNNNFSLKKFLTENKLTTNSKKLEEVAEGKSEYTEDEVKYSIGVDDDYEGWVDVAFQKGFKYDEDKDQWYGPVDEIASGGYVELMDIDDHLENIHYEWEKWREGPMTEPGDITPAKKDVLQYIINYLKRSLK